MKVNGRLVDKPNEVLVVLPREGGDLAFKFRAVTDIKSFEKMCPEPSPPKTRKTGGETYFNMEDPDFKRQLDEWASRQTHWQFLMSISATDGLEWDRVKLDDPGTYQLWQEDLIKAGFSVGERNAIWAGFMRANSVSEAMLEEARKRFLSSQSRAEESLLSQMVAPLTTGNGELVNASVSDQKELEVPGT